MPACFSKNTTELEALLGISFLNRDILSEALTHKSFHHESHNKKSFYNERLEFLGDSVLGLIVAEHLFGLAPMLSEAQMSKLKSQIVKEAVLYEIALDLAVGDYLRLGKGEELSGGRHKKSLLADAVEALIGAVFLDAGYDAAKMTVLKLFEKKIWNALSKKDGVDYKSELQEFTQEFFGKLPLYNIVNEQGEEHEKVFTSEVYIDCDLLGTGRGRSKKESEKAAAKEALAKIKPAKNSS
ncbi:MAG: ribonuclease III [Nitrospirae bacterium]|nr:ribonuclease III [Nitrospirota bacterium]